MYEDLITILLVVICAIALYFISKFDSEYTENNHKDVENREEELELINQKLKNLNQKIVLHQNDKNDDLTKIEGIGPRIQELLYSRGIKTFETLAYTYISDLQKILDEAGNNFNMANPKNWPIQAKMAYEGRWQELENYQENLYKNINLELDSKLNPNTPDLI